MLSILIPTYNYNIYDLVYDLHKQATNTGIIFEIIALDDKSKNSTILTNKAINKFDFTKYILSEKNNGRAITKQILYNEAKFGWILFLDADVRLKDDYFISNYLNAFKSDYEVIFGGIIYEKTPPNANSLLRWKYGVACEAISSKKRNKAPYKITSAANILIKKKVYESLSLGSIGNSYGMDIFFGPQLKLNKIPVLHIDNEVYHLGLENSKTYLKKTKDAVETLLNLHYQKKVKLHENDLLKTFILCKKSGVNHILSLFFKLFHNLISKNLLGKNPSIKFLQFYKLSYICFKDLDS